MIIEPTYTKGVVRLLTIEELSSCLQLAPKTIRNMVDQRRIPFVKAGRLVRFNPEKINNWIEARSKKVI